MNEEARTRIAVGEEGTDGQQDFGNSQSRAPVVFQDVQTNRSLTVYITVIDSCAKCDLRNQVHGEWD